MLDLRWAIGAEVLVKYNASIRAEAGLSGRSRIRPRASRREDSLP